MGNMIRATPDRTSRPYIYDIKHQGRVHRDVWMPDRRRLPCTVTPPSHEFALLARGAQRYRTAIAQDSETRIDRSRHLDLQSLHRRVHVAYGEAAGSFFSQNVPRLQGAPQLHAYAAPGHRTDHWKSKLEVRREPFPLKLVTGFAQVCHHIFPIELSEVRQHEPVMQRGSPPHELAAVRSLPEMRNQRAHEQLLSETHTCVRRHFECPQFHQTKPRFGSVGRIELVDAKLGTVRIAGHIC